MVKVYLRRADDAVQGSWVMHGGETWQPIGGVRKVYEFPEGTKTDTTHEGWIIVQHAIAAGEKPPPTARRNLFQDYEMLDLAAFPIAVVEAVIFENPDHSQPEKKPKEKK